MAPSKIIKQNNIPKSLKFYVPKKKPKKKFQTCVLDQKVEGKETTLHSFFFYKMGVVTIIKTTNHCDMDLRLRCFLMCGVFLSTMPAKFTTLSFIFERKNWAVECNNF
jgi:hypothetical protein